MPRILLVEDDLFLQTILKTTLEQAAYEVQCAWNGEEAMALLEEQPPDLMITDIVMPKKSGITLISEMKERYPAIPIIAISGGGNINPEEYLALSTRLGANLILQKPIDHAMLLQSVTAALHLS